MKRNGYSKSILYSIVLWGALAIGATSKPLPPTKERIAPELIEGFGKVSSTDGRVTATFVTVYRGSAVGGVGPIVSIHDPGPNPNGQDYYSATSFSIPGMMVGPPTGLKLEKTSATLYRLSFDVKNYSYDDNTGGYRQLAERRVYDIVLASSGALERFERNLKGAPARKYSSYWNHNGSLVGLVAQGNRRSFYYVKPRAGLAVGVGTLLFSGTTNGKSYSGTAYRFMKGQNPIGYQVTGPIGGNGTKIVIGGKAPVRDASGKVVRYTQDQLVFEFQSK